MHSTKIIRPKFQLEASLKKYCLLATILFTFITPAKLFSQVDEDQLGTWYMYFWNTSIKDSPWGFQGDFQYRSWNAINDFEQRILRGGLTYTLAETDIKLTMGYADFLSGVFGNDDSTSWEHRIYQEALIPKKIGNRFYFTHRFRFEQRFIGNQNFRTRYRYNLFLNIPLNNSSIESGTVYLAFYNEVFFNGQSNIGKGKSVGFFDRNWAYAALGYAINKQFKVQLGIMHHTTPDWSKNQMQFSVHHSF
ncbi:MAG: DUF2490 domain-containing protein [Verrucomicrobiota bacterium]